MKKKGYCNWNLKSKLLVIISSLLIFAISLVTVLNTKHFLNYLTEQTIIQTQQVIDQIGLNVDTYLNELFRLSRSPYFDDSVLDELETRTCKNWEKLDKQRHIENFLGSVMILPRKDILGVYILTDSDYYYNSKISYGDLSSFKYLNTEWYKKAITEHNQIFIPVHTESVFGKMKIQVFSIVQALWSKEDNDKVLGVIKVDANYNGIKSICDKVQLSPESALLILDHDRNIIYSNSTFSVTKLDSTFYSKILQTKGGNIKNVGGNKYIINTNTLVSTGWTVAVVHSYNAIKKYSSDMQDASIIIAIICIVIAVILLAFVVREFLRPLFSIVYCMKDIQKGNLDVHVEVRSHDEVGYLGQSFNSMIDTIKNTMNRNAQLVKEVYEMQYLQKQAQYDTLCSQIRPHFLNNTLNTISLLIKCGESEQAVGNIEKLSALLHGIMNTDKDIPLSAELKIVDSYLGLQKSRYGDQLSYNLFIDRKFKNYNLPALTLQPLVENAIIHGCEHKRGKSEITVSSSCDKNRLYLHVIDNGAGMDTEQLENLCLELKKESIFSNNLDTDIFSKSIGIINVHRRIKLKFGSDFGLSIESIMNEGTHVMITLPLSMKGEI